MQPPVSQRKTRAVRSSEAESARLPSAVRARVGRTTLPRETVRLLPLRPPGYITPRRGGRCAAPHGVAVPVTVQRAASLQRRPAPARASFRAGACSAREDSGAKRSVFAPPPRAARVLNPTSKAARGTAAPCGAAHRPPRLGAETPASGTPGRRVRPGFRERDRERKRAIQVQLPPGGTSPPAPK